LGHEVVAEPEIADGILICNPTSVHLETALKVLPLKKPIFIEKPLSHNLDGLNQLKGTIFVGYCLRFDQSLKDFKQKVDKVNRSKIKSVKIVCQSWLPDWRPGKDYRQTYSAKKSLGGGVLLDLSHEIDYALWFFGPVKKVSARLEQAPELEIETEAIADLNLKFVSGVTADFHLSYASHTSERYCEILTDSGTLRWDYQPNNEMYLEEIKHFIRVCEGKEKPLVTVNDGINVLKVIEAAKINHL
jgi:hypothetical protein